MVRFARETVPQGLLHEVFAEVLEDFAFAEAIREGSQTELVERDKVFEVLEGRADFVLAPLHTGSEKDVSDGSHWTRAEKSYLSVRHLI
jgi:hypothetical protein